MKKVYAIGAGMTKFGRHPDKTGRDLIIEAALETVDSVDRGIDLQKDVEASWIGYFTPELYEHQGQYGPITSDCLGLVPKPAWRTEIACASSSAAILTGFFAVRSGVFDLVLVGGIEKMTTLSTEGVTDALSIAADNIFELPAGITFPGIFALIAQAYFKKYNVTWEDLQAIPIKSHHNGTLNPKAQYQSEVLELGNKFGKKKGISFKDPMDFLKSPLNPTVAYPLRLFDCCPITDGASFLLFASGDVAKKYTDTPIEMAGVGNGTETLSLHDRPEMTSSRATIYASKMAYKMAGVRPKDIDCTEVHDCFSINEVIQIEDLGLVPRGEGIKAAKEGRTSLDGDIPINMDGGLKSKGHPVGATGAGMFCEIWKQLRGEAGKRQIPDAEIGMISNVGGSAASAGVFILRR